jgi:integrase
MTTEIDTDFEDLGPAARPIKWATFKAKVQEAWPGPPLCSEAHARNLKWLLRDIEAIDLAGDGEPARTIRSTGDLDLRLAVRYHKALAAHRTERGGPLSPWTIKTRLANLRCLCTFAFESRWLAVNPFALRPVRRFVRTGKPRGKRHLTKAECRQLLEVLGGDVRTRKGWALWRAHRLRAAVVIALHCGLRRNELLRLQVSDVDLPGRLIRVKPHGKTLKTAQSEDSVPIPEAAVGIIEEWLKHWRLAGPEGYPVPADCPWLIPNVCRKGPWTGGAPGERAFDMLKAVGKRAGIPDVNWQMLRRTTATMLAAMGVGGAMIARILRHSQAVDEAFYQGRDEESMKDAARGLEF